MLLAFVRYDAKDSKGIRRCLSTMEHTLGKKPDDSRIRRQVEIIKILGHAV